MPANTAPIFVLTPVQNVVQISTANTARDGTGTIGDGPTAGSNGTRIDRITIEATGTTTAGVVRIFIHNGSAYRLWKEVLVTALTPSTTVAAFRSVQSANPMLPLLMLPTGYKVAYSTHNAETFNVFTEGGDY
jgi:hypothetical protein